MARNLCTVLLLCLSAILSAVYGELSFEGVSPHQYDLLSYTDEATCQHHKPYLCGDEYTDQFKVPSLQPVLEDIDECRMKLTCPSNQFNSSCLSHSKIIPDLTYQFVHTEAYPTTFKYRFSWEALPDDCNVQYYTVIYSERFPGMDNDTCNGYSSIGNCYPLNLTGNAREVSVDFDVFRRLISSDDTGVLTRYFKLIAYPVYEWPTLEFEIPGRCEEAGFKNALGCSTCKDCTVPEVPPQNFNVVYSISDQNSLSANISWQSVNHVVRYYLHINSSSTKHLYWFTEDVSQFTITGMDSTETYEIWLEYFFCDCSPPTEIFRFPPSDGSGQIMAVSTYSSKHSSSSVIPSMASSSSLLINSSSPSVKSMYTVSHIQTMQTSSTPSLATLPSNSVQISVTITAKPSPSPFTDESQTTLYISIIIPIVFVVIGAVVIVIIFVLVKRRFRKSVSCGVWYSPNKPTVVQPQPLANRNVTYPSLPTKVMLIYSTETKEKKLLEILAFLDDELGSLTDEHGHKLFKVCRYDTSTERDHPSEWLDKNYKYCDYIICVVGKKFKREWNDEVRPDTPLVYAFHQLFNASFTSTANPLGKIVVVLGNKSKDEQHIPSQYLQGRKTYSLDDIDGLASYMLGRPRHIFFGESTSAV